MCSGHKSAAVAGAATTLRSAPLLWASRPAGRERSPPAAAGCTQRCGAVPAPRCTEQADLLLLPPRRTGPHRSEPGYVDPAGQEENEEEEERGVELRRQTNKQTNKGRLNWCNFWKVCDPSRAEPNHTDRGRSRWAVSSLDCHIFGFKWDLSPGFLYYSNSEWLCCRGDMKTPE